MPERNIRGFSWIPRGYDTDYSILVSGTDLIGTFLSCEFSKTIAPEIGTFLLRLDNNNGEYSGKYVGGETFEVKYDFGATATTTIYKGFVEEVNEVFDETSGSVLELRGSHVSAVLADKIVIKSYANALANIIITDLFNSYFPSFTMTNVQASTTSITISWNSTPFWKAIADVAEIVGFTVYVDDNLDCHFFPEGSITNTNEAVVFEDTFISMEGLGTDTIEVKNDVRIFGELDGLPILYTTSDASSKAKFKLSFSDGSKESVIDDSNVKSYDEAKLIGDGLLSQKNDIQTSGKITSFLLATLNAGEKVWVTNPIQKILNTHIAAKVTNQLPNEITTIDILKVKSVANLFRDRDVKTLKLEEVKNPYNLNHSYNFSFDDNNLTDGSATESNVTIQNSQLLLSSGTLGVWISKTRNLTSDLSRVQVKVLGESLTDAEFLVSANGVTWQQVNIDELSTISDTGRLLRLRINLKSATVRVSSVAILYT